MRDQSNQQEEYEEQKDEEQEVIDFSKPDYVFIPKGIHKWIQRGPYLECRDCDIHHAVFVGVNKQMVGVTENGLPILKKVM